ncbi:MAG: hypothetical protein ACK4NF_07720, partial [Planctomycetota bacterium]
MNDIENQQSSCKSPNLHSQEKKDDSQKNFSTDLNIGKEIKIISLEEYENLKNKEKELEETIDLLKRTRADYLNYIKIARKQQEEIKEYA